MLAKDQINLCIDLINWIDDTTISNDEILFRIKEKEYLEKSFILEENRGDNAPKKSLYRLVAKVKRVLEEANPDLSIHNQRYPCSYLDLKQYLIQVLEKNPFSEEELMDFLSKAKDKILQIHLAEYIAEYFLEKEAVNKALSLIDFVENKDNHYRIYRKVAQYYAEKGDEALFMKTLKKCDARKDVFEMEYIKDCFVVAFSKQNDWENVLRMIQKKEFGKKYLVSAMDNKATTFSFEEIKDILSDPIFEDEKLYLKEIIFTKSFVQNPLNQTPENFDFLKERLKNIPAKVRYGNSDFSLSDNLWSNIAESLEKHQKEAFSKQIAYCIRQINSKILKRSFKKTNDE